MRSLKQLPFKVAVAFGILSFLLAIALLLWPGFGTFFSPSFLGPLKFANRVRVAEVCLTMAGFSGTIAVLITASQAITKGQRTPELAILLASKHARLSRVAEGRYLLHLPFHHSGANGDMIHVALLDMVLQNNGDLTATRFAVLLTPQPVGQSPRIELAGPSALSMADGDYMLDLTQDGSFDFGWKASCAGGSRGSMRYGDWSDLVPGDECDLPTVNVALVVPPKSTDAQPRYPRVLIRALASNAKRSEAILGVTPDPRTGDAEDEADP